MEFDLIKEVNRLKAVWQTILIEKPNKETQYDFYLYGPRGSGKTKIAQEFVRSNANAFYFSFENMSNSEALEYFCAVYLPETEKVNDWNSAAKMFLKKRRYKQTLLIFEDENTVAAKECSRAFSEYVYGNKFLRTCEITTEEPYEYYEEHAFVNRRTVSHYFKEFPDYTKEDIMRLHALTGGLLSVAKELDRDKSFEENVHTLLKYDSAFSNHLPHLLLKCFRTPESYYPILKSIAYGRHRLSEIAKEVGFPNNKCGKYLEALIKHKFVVARTDVGSKQAKYHLENSYYAAWCLYAYNKKALQIAKPDELFSYVMNTIDNKLTIPAFHDACMRYIEASTKYYLTDYQYGNIVQTKRAVKVKLPDGKEVIFDYIVTTKGCDLDFAFVFAQSIHVKYTKEEVETIRAAAEQLDILYNTNLTIFSFNRFSDWCVHEAKMNDNFYLVTVERLKY